MIDVTKASRETVNEFLSLQLKVNTTSAEAIRIIELRQQLRAECAAPKLRSRAEVDADIVDVVRSWPTRIDPVSMAQHLDQHCGTLDRLVSEPTAEEPAGKTLTLTADIEALAKSLRETLNPSELVMLADLIDPTAGKEPAELDLSEHEVCSCEEAEKLKARVAELEERIEKQRLAIDALNESRRKVLAALGRT